MNGTESQCCRKHQNKLRITPKQVSSVTDLLPISGMIAYLSDSVLSVVQAPDNYHCKPAS